MCLCEDVTYEDVLKAIDEGYTDIESLKRYLRIGAGFCQGRICLSIAVKILANKLGKSYYEIKFPTQRQPLISIPLGLLAGEARENGH